MSKSQKTAKPADTHVIWTVLIGIAVIGLGHAILAMSPSVWTWGSDYWSELPRVMIGLLIALIVVALVPSIARKTDEALSIFGNRRLAVLAGLGVALFFFMAFRSHGHSYGDGYSLLGSIAGGSLPEFKDQMRTQALDIVAHWAAFRAVILPAGGTPELSYAWLSAIAGVLSLIAISRIAGQVGGKSVPARWFVIASAVTSGAAALWFGYVEVYSLAAAASLWSIALALEGLKRGSRLKIAWGVWLVACAFHMSSLAFGPAILWATIRTNRRMPKRPSQMMAIMSLGAAFVVTGLATVLFSSITDTHIFVPIISNSDTFYTAFAFNHLTDMLNLLILAAPVGIIALWVWLFGHKDSAQEQSSTGSHRFAQRGVLAMAAVGSGLFAFWVDPTLGAFRDWDLLSGFGIPLSLWGATVILQRARQSIVASRVWVPVAALALVHTGGFVAHLNDAKAAMERVDRLVREDVHYTNAYFHGDRLTPWSRTLGSVLHRYDLALDHLRIRTRLASDDPFAWANLGSAYRQVGNNDSAAVCFERAIAMDSVNQQWLENLGILYYDLFEYQSARDVLERVLQVGDSSIDQLTLLTRSYMKLREYDQAQIALESLQRRNPNQPIVQTLQGQIAQFRGDTASAIRHFESAIAMGSRSQDPYIMLTQLHVARQHPDSALAAARLWENSFPQSPGAPFYVGASLLMLEDHSGANAAFLRTLQLEPNNAMAVYYLSTTYRHLGDTAQARRWAEYASELDTILALPYLEMVYLAADAGDTAEAARAAREFIKRSPMDSSMLYLQQFLTLGP